GRCPSRRLEREGPAERQGSGPFVPAWDRTTHAAAPEGAGPRSPSGDGRPNHLPRMPGTAVALGAIPSRKGEPRVSSMEVPVFRVFVAAAVAMALFSASQAQACGWRHRSNYVVYPGYYDAPAYVQPATYSYTPTYVQPATYYYTPTYVQP